MLRGLRFLWYGYLGRTLEIKSWGSRSFYINMNQNVFCQLKNPTFYPKTVELIVDWQQVESIADSDLQQFFCYAREYCQRKSRPIHTKVINDIIQPEFSEAPENINYNLDFWERGLSDEQKEQLRTEGIQDECVVLRKHQTRASEAFVACDACNSTGRLKCPACGGSGREQYVDGYYASGEERIKTGSCSECQGHGQVPCPDCQGQGRIEIFSQNYTVEKSVTETWKQHTVIAYNSPSM